MIAIETRGQWYGHVRAVADQERAPTGLSSALPQLGAGPAATITHALAEWRAAERALTACPLGATDRFVLEAAVGECRAAYHRMFDERCPPGRRAAAEAVAIDWDAAFRWLAGRAAAIGD